MERALRAMAANLAPDGVLAFDVNTLTAYREPGDRIVEDGERIVLWHGGPARLDEPGGRAEVAMDVMSRRSDGLWRRASASWGHWHYPLASIPAIADAAGLEIVAVRGQHTGGRLEPGADEERHAKAVFLARHLRSERSAHALAALVETPRGVPSPDGGIASPQLGQRTRRTSRPPLSSPAPPSRPRMRAT
jgi:hypothetical protein